MYVANNAQMSSNAGYRSLRSAAIEGSCSYAKEPWRQRQLQYGELLPCTETFFISGSFGAALSHPVSRLALTIDRLRIPYSRGTVPGNGYVPILNARYGRCGGSSAHSDQRFDPVTLQLVLLQACSNCAAPRGQ